MKRRTARTRSRAEWKKNLAGMTEAQKKAFNETRRRTAKSGYAKRQRERDNGAPMASRTGEGVRKRFETPRSTPGADFGAWLIEFHRMTA